MFFTSKEKQAIAVVGLLMQEVDGKTDKREVDANKAMFAKIQVTQADINAANTMQVGEAITVLSAMTEDKKDLVASFLGALMIVDGEADETEVTLWQFVSTMCSFPNMNILDACLKFKQFLLQ